MSIRCTKRWSLSSGELRQVADCAGQVPEFGSLGAPDEFDSWSLERDRRDDQAASSRTAQYVDPDVNALIVPVAL